MKNLNNNIKEKDLKELIEDTFSEEVSPIVKTPY